MSQKINQQKVEYYTQKYYKDLHGMVDRIIRKFGGLSQKDTDDFYSLANEVFVLAANDFNGKGNFKGFLYSRLVLKIRTMITERNRKKRSDIEIIKHKDGSVEKVYHQPISLDATIKNNDEYTTYGEMIASDFNIMDKISDEIGLSFSIKVNTYLDKLPKSTRRIALLLSEGYKSDDIRDKLHISEKEYNSQMNILKAYENIKCLIM